MNRFQEIILKALLLFSPSILFITSLSANTTEEKNSLAIFYTFKGNIQKPFNTIVENKLKKIGFDITDPHKRVNDQYKKKYGSTVLDVLSFMSIVNDKEILPLLNIDPRIAGFSPFNMLIYKKLDENNTHIGHLMPTAILDILEIEDKTVREKFINSFKPLDEKLESEFKNKSLKFTKSYMPYKKLTKKRMINFEFKFERPEDLEDFLDDFQNEFELAFIDKDYLIAGYHNFMEGIDNAEEILSGYDAFWTYSLCHLKFSYTIFDGQKSRADSGVFAPCTMYMYIKKDSHQLVIGMPKLANWQAVNNITDKTKVDFIKHLDEDIPKTLVDLGAKIIPSSKPTMTLEELKRRAVIIFREIDKKVNELETMIKDLEKERK
jgi:uncharacterized protein (DUF302 family)